MPGLYTQQLITTTVNQPVDGVGVVQSTVMPSPQDFFSEYSVSGWFKWIPPTNQGQWSLVFRFSNTDKNVVENLAYLGDRDLSVWLGKSQQAYHYSTYDYNDLAGGGDPNWVQWIGQGNNLNNQWNFYYFGYSRTLRRAFGAVVFYAAGTTGSVLYQNCDHYLINHGYLQVGNDIVSGGQ